MKGALALVLSLVAPLGAAAQDMQWEGPDGRPIAREGDEESAPDAGEGEEASEGEGDGSDWVRPRLLVIRDRQTPRRLMREVTGLFESVGDVVAGTEFEREARARGLPPTSATAFEQLLPDLDVALVIVVGVSRVGGRAHVTLSYREGRFGLELLDEEHPLAGDRLTEAQQGRVTAEARLAMAAVTRPEAPVVSATGDAQSPLVSSSRDEASVEPGAAVHIGVSAGFGIGTRFFEMPAAPGIVRLSTSPFPAAQLRLRVELEPTARGRVTVLTDLSYLTSVGLRTTDMRLDGTSRQTASRSQRLSMVGALRYRFGEELTRPTLEGRLGWAFRLFSSEAPVTLPDFGLSGPELGIELRLPFAQGRVALGFGPSVHVFALVTDGLAQHGVGRGVGVGGEARVHVELTAALALEAFYRESHSFLSTSIDRDVSDVERFATVQAIYRP